MGTERKATTAAEDVIEGRSHETGDLRHNEQLVALPMVFPDSRAASWFGPTLHATKLSTWNSKFSAALRNYASIRSGRKRTRTSWSSQAPRSCIIRVHYGIPEIRKNWMGITLMLYGVHFAQLDAVRTWALVLGPFAIALVSAQVAERKRHRKY